MALPQPDPARRARYRHYPTRTDSRVRTLYQQNHAHQTLDFVLRKKTQYLSLRRHRMSVWEAMQALDKIHDASDPDLGLSQLDHALQTAEALRDAGKPDWLVLTGLVHDLGKVLCLFGEPQWAVVGDTFPVGCAFSKRIVHADLFEANPDLGDPARSSRLGIYREGCGLDRVHLAWGHDEYLHQVLRHHLPEQALYVIRYHSFYAQHQERAYDFLLDGRDRRLMPEVRSFQAFDLYSKAPLRPDFEKLRPFYEDLVAKFLPDELFW
jgi:inositol oxygenase